MSKENFNEEDKNGSEKELEPVLSKKRLRFQLEDENSIESFSSALSTARDEEGNEENSKISILKNYVQNPTQDIAADLPQFVPCFSKEREMPRASSYQLLEIVKHSPVSSNADLKLVNSIYYRRIEGIKEALRNGANVNTFKHRQTPLLIATEIGDPRLVAYLLTVPNIDLDLPNTFGETPLLIAVKNSSEKIIKLLLDNHADVNKADYTGKTPLQVALFLRSANLIKLLLAYGADCEKSDAFGEKPMHTVAVRRPHLESLLILLKTGAKPEYYNNSGMSLLSRAILNRSQFKIIQTLIRFGASVNSQDWYSKKTPLHFAALVNDLEVTNYLLNHGADPNKTTVYHFTPFDEAVAHRNLKVAEILLKHTKKPNVKNYQALKLQKTGKKE